MTPSLAPIPTRRTRRNARRGGTYVFFLLTTTIVMLMGLASIAVTRAEVTRASSADRLAQARALSISAIEHVTARMYTDKNWRTELPHDTWSAEEALGLGTVRWKIVDEVNGSMTADPLAPVRVYGRGDARGATWIYSVEVQPPVTEDAIANPADLVRDIATNGSMNDGTNGWSGVGPVTLESTNGGGPHSSDRKPHLWVRSRSAATDGAAQQVGHLLTNGKAYALSCEVRFANDDDNVVVRLYITATGGNHAITIADTPVGDSWTVVSGSVVPVWSGDLTAAAIAFETRTTHDEYYLDGVTLTTTADIPTKYGPVAGTWRREPAD